MEQPKQKGHSPNSKYLSKESRELWDQMTYDYQFQGMTIEKSERDYSTTVNSICNYLKKDFLEITPEDVDQYIAYLLRRVEGEESPSLSRLTMYTYLKSLRSIGNHFEYIMQIKRLAEGKSEEDGYTNPFAGKVKLTKEVSDMNRSMVRLQRRYEVKKKDIEKLLEKVLQEEGVQGYLLLYLIAAYGFSSYELCTFRGDQVLLGERGEVTLVHEKRMHLPKTTGISEEVQDIENGNSDTICKTNYILDERAAELFLKHWKQERTQEMLNKKNLVFYNRFMNQLNFKNISSLLKKHKESMDIDYILTTKELTGILIELC